MANIPDNTGKKQANRTSFKPGASGNPKGRPKGSRSKLGEAFLSDLQADWQENGPEVIQAVREKSPAIYLRVIASILPRDLNVTVNPLEEATDEELVERLRQLESVIRPYLELEGDDDDCDGDEAPRARLRPH